MRHRPQHAALDDAGADGVAGEAGGVVDVELRHKMLAMLLDGLDADAEFPCDFLVGLALGNQLQHFHLARSQLGKFMNFGVTGPLRVETVKMFGNGGAENRFPFMDFPDGPAHIVG